MKHKITKIHDKASSISKNDNDKPALRFQEYEDMIITPHLKIIYFKVTRAMEDWQALKYTPGTPTSYCGSISSLDQKFVLLY